MSERGEGGKGLGLGDSHKHSQGDVVPQISKISCHVLL